MEELLSTGLSTKVTFKAAMSSSLICFGSDCNKESSFIIPSLTFLEIFSSTAETICPPKASTNLKEKVRGSTALKKDIRQDGLALHGLD